MLQVIVDYLLYILIGLDPTTRLAQSLNFFIYDSIKIMFLLFFMIAIVGVLRTYLPQRKVKKWLSKTKYGSGNFMASLFGAVTPFCSCSSIPLFLSFLEAGVPLGVTFSFLITSPLVNEYLVVLMLGFFGWKITLAYVIAGILIGMISGLVLGKMNLEKYLVKDIISSKSKLKEEKYNVLPSELIEGFFTEYSTLFIFRATTFFSPLLILYIPIRLVILLDSGSLTYSFS